MHERLNLNNPIFGNLRLYKVFKLPPEEGGIIEAIVSETPGERLEIEDIVTRFTHSGRNGVNLLGAVPGEYKGGQSYLSGDSKALKDTDEQLAKIPQYRRTELTIVREVT